MTAYSDEEIMTQTITKFHPALATCGETIDADEIARFIHALDDLDSNVRVDACNVLRCVPRDKLETAYLAARPLTNRIGYGEDCLRRMAVQFPQNSDCERAVISVVSPGYEKCLKMCVDSFHARANSPEARFFVFALNESYDEVTTWSGVTAIRCEQIARLSAAVKGAIYSCASLLNAKYMVSVEADMLFVDSIQPLWKTLENAHETTIWGARSQTHAHRFHLSEVLGHMRAPQSDLEWLTRRAGYDSLFWYNGGLIAGHRAAWLDLEARIKSFGAPALAYVDGAFQQLFADEFIFNLAVGLMSNRAELTGVWNCQVHDQKFEHWIKTESDGSYSRLGERVKIAHLLGKQRPFMLEIMAQLGLQTG